MAENEKATAVAWQAFIDLRQDIEVGFAGINRRLDATNGHIANLHTWRDRTLGALVVLSMLMTSFGATALALMVK